MNYMLVCIAATSIDTDLMLKLFASPVRHFFKLTYSLCLLGLHRNLFRFILQEKNQ